MKSPGRVSLLAALCIAAASCDRAPARKLPIASVDAPVNSFLHFYFHGYAGNGLPDSSQLPELASFVTPGLLGLFKAGMRGEDCYANKHDQGPLPIEGDLFSSLFEGATSATYRLATQEPGKATVEMEWTNASSTAGPPFSWKDRVFLVRTTRGWLISDFAHDGTWDFMIKGSVSQILGRLAKECGT